MRGSIGSLADEQCLSVEKEQNGCVGPVIFISGIIHGFRILCYPMNSSIPVFRRFVIEWKSGTGNQGGICRYYLILIAADGGIGLVEHGDAVENREAACDLLYGP